MGERAGEGREREGGWGRGDTSIQVNREWLTLDGELEVMSGHAGQRWQLGQETDGRTAAVEQTCKNNHGRF